MGEGCLSGAYVIAWATSLLKSNKLMQGEPASKGGESLRRDTLVLTRERRMGVLPAEHR